MKVVSTIYEKFPEATAEEEELEQKTERPSTALGRHVARLVLLSSTRRDITGGRLSRKWSEKPPFNLCQTARKSTSLDIYILDVCMKHIKEIGNFREDRWPTFCREGKGKLGKLLNYGVVLVFRMCF